MKYRGTLTSSKISTFNRCKKLFHDTYVNKLDIVRPYALERGSKVHGWIEKAITKNEIGTEIDLGDESIRFVLETISLIKKGAKKIFVESNFALAKDYVTLVPYDSDSFLRGTFDLVSENKDGSILLVDWKTGVSKPEDFQLQIYSWILRKVYPIQDIRAKFVCVDKCKVIEVQEKEDIEDELKRISDEVYSEENWLPETGWYCSFCPLVKNRYEYKGEEVSEATYKRLKAKKEDVKKIEISRPKECACEKPEFQEVSIDNFLRIIA